MNINNPRKSSKKTPLVVFVCAAIVIILVYGVFAKINSTWPFRNTSTSETGSQTLTDQDSNPINMSPGTSEDQKAANQQKQQDYERDQSSSGDNSSTTKKTVSVTITTYSQTDNEVLVNGFVSGVVESGGICKLTLTDTNGKQVSSTRQSAVSGTNTTCGQSSIKTSLLHPGSWSVQLSYSSDSAIGATGANSVPPIEVR